MITSSLWGLKNKAEAQFQKQFVIGMANQGPKNKSVLLKFLILQQIIHILTTR